jgi:hypothetical protein
MFSMEASDIYDAFKPLHIWSQFLGLTSFKVRKENGVLKEFCTIFNVLSILFSSISGTALYINILISFMDASFWEQKAIFMSEVFVKSMIIIVLVTVTTAVIINWWTFCNRTYFSLIFNQLNAVDEKLQELDVNLNHKSYKKSVMLWTVGSAVFMVSIYVSMKIFIHEIYFFKMSEIMKIFVLTEISSMHLLLVLQYINLLKILKLRFKKLNFFIEVFFLAPFNNLYVEERGFRMINLEMKIKLKQAACVHDKLVDISESMNRLYGVPVSKYKGLFTKYVFQHLYGEV